MEDANEILKSLQTETNDAKKSEENLQKLIQNVKELNISEIEPFANLLTKQSAPKLHRLAAQAIAELSKEQANREKFTNGLVIEPLLNLLSTTDTRTLVQTCRALGNICYENEAARKIVTIDGFKKVVSIIEKHYANPANCELLTVECGFLLNLLMSNDDLLKIAIDSKVPELVVRVLHVAADSFQEYETCVTHLLLVLNMLMETMREPWYDKELSKLLMQILLVSVNPEISELALELLHNQAEDDDIKLFLAKEQACEKLHTLIEEHIGLVTDKESHSLLKLACDLIVLILTGEESMKLLYRNGSSKVYDDAVSWLSSKHIDLVVTGVLSIGNFARNDQHCLTMVKSGLSKKLIDILKTCNTSTGDIRLQHAVLSALRNLVIPAQNKEQMLKEGLLEALYPMLSIEQSAVVFKLLGSIRMAVDGQEKFAQDLLNNKEFLAKIVGWCTSSDHPGVRGEAPRLLAWLIKNSCRSKSDCLQTVLHVDDCIKCLVEMIPSSHGVMQNEAILALNLCAHNLLTKTPDDVCKETSKQDKANVASGSSESKIENKSEKCHFAKCVIDADIAKMITILLSKYSDKIEKEIVQNLMVLMKVLLKNDEVALHFQSSEVPIHLAKLLEREALRDLHLLIKDVSQACEKHNAHT